MVNLSKRGRVGVSGEVQGTEIPWAHRAGGASEANHSRRQDRRIRLGHHMIARISPGKLAFSPLPDTDILRLLAVFR